MNEPKHGNSEEKKDQSSEAQSDNQTKTESAPTEANQENNEPNKEADKKLSPMPKGNKDMKLKDFRKKMSVGPGNFWNNMLSTLLLLIFVTALFSYLTDAQTEPDQLSITEVAQQVKAGEIETIIVRGAVLEIN